MVRRVVLTLVAGLELALVGNLLLMFVFGLVSAPYHGPPGDTPVAAYVQLALAGAAAVTLLLALTLAARPAPRGTLLARGQMAGLLGLTALNLAGLGWFGYGMVETRDSVGPFVIVPFLFAVVVVALAVTELPAQRTGSAAHR